MKRAREDDRDERRPRDRSRERRDRFLLSPRMCMCRWVLLRCFASATIHNLGGATTGVATTTESEGTMITETEIATETVIVTETAETVTTTAIVTATEIEIEIETTAAGVSWFHASFDPVPHPL